MVSQLFRLFIGIAFFQICIGQTVKAQSIGGVISTNTTLLQSESPYMVTKNTLVSQGVTLTIEPGVVLNFKDSSILQVDGTIRAIGTAENPIVFTGMPGAVYYNFMPAFGHGWGGIYFSELSTDYDTLTGSGSIIEHAAILRVVGGRWLYGSGTETRETNPLFMRKCSPYISHTEIAFYRGYIGVDESNGIFRNCNIHDAAQGVIVGPLVPSNSYKPLIENCLFHDFKVEFPSDTRVPVTLNGSSYFANNCLRNITNEFALTIPMDGPEVLNNRFENCTQVAIGNFGMSYSYKIIGNTFTGNNINMTFTACPRMPQIYGNNFNNYTSYNIYAAQNYYLTPGGIPITSDCSQAYTSFDLDITNNYWGGLNPAQIEESIHDYNDDFIEKINVVYDNFSGTLFNVEEPSACNFVDQTHLFSVGENTKSTLRVWPNPIASGELLNITVVEAGTYQLSITNILGQVVFNREVFVGSKEAIQQPLDGLEKGCYILSIVSNKKRYTQRIIISGN